MSTTQDEAVSIWLDRNLEDARDWSGRSDIVMVPDGNRIILRWTEWDQSGVAEDREHAFTGTLAELVDQIGAIRAGN